MSNYEICQVCGGVHYGTCCPSGINKRKGQAMSEYDKLEKEYDASGHEWTADSGTTLGFAKWLVEQLILARQQLAAMAWRGMDSAPKDGTFILVKENGVVNKVSWTDDYIHYPNSAHTMCWCVYGSFQDEQGGYEVVYNPDGWMPLPVQPEEG